MIITAYGSGHIRLFSTSTSSDPQLLVEVAAHARWITALDVAMDEGTVLSVSEDSFVKVWDIIETNTTVYNQFIYNFAFNTFSQYNFNCMHMYTILLI